MSHVGRHDAVDEAEFARTGRRRRRHLVLAFSEFSEPTVNERVKHVRPAVKLALKLRSRSWLTRSPLNSYDGGTRFDVLYLIH